MRHPYTRGLFTSIPLPGADKNARPLVAIRGQLPLPHARPEGCYFGPRCDHFAAGRCDRRPLPMLEVEPGSSHSVRCIRFREIDWTAAKPKAVEREPVRAGEMVLHVDELTKPYKIETGGLPLGGA